MSKEPFNTRAYLVKVDRYKRKDQIADCRRVAKELDLPKLHSIYEHSELEAFIKHLQTDEIALVSRLEGLKDGTERGVGTRFLMNINRVCATSMVILDVDTGIRSDSGKEWDNLIDQVYNKVTRSNNTLTTEQARAKALIPNKEPGLEEAWERKKRDKTDDYIAHARIWGNRGIKPARKAIDQFPDAELRDVHKSTIYRIFGSRQECEQWLNENL